jgi:hypothetical protein
MISKNLYLKSLNKNNTKHNTNKHINNNNKMKLLSLTLVLAFLTVVAFHLVTADVAPKPLSSYRINCGATANYTDSKGNLWLSDRYFNHGTADHHEDTITGTADQTLYQYERYEDTGDSLKYSLNLLKGTYTIKLHFAEIWSGAQGNGLRTFDVTFNDEVMAANLDIYAEAGGYKPFIKTFTIGLARDQVLTIGFNKKIQNPKVSAIEAAIVQSNPPPTPSPPAAHSSPVPEDSHNNRGDATLPVPSEEQQHDSNAASSALPIIGQFVLLLVATVAVMLW